MTCDANKKEENRKMPHGLNKLVLKSISSSNLGRFVFCILYLLVCLHFIGFLREYTVNGPFADDYQAILKSTNDWVKNNSIENLLEITLSQHNEHKIFFVRLAAITYYSLFNQLNFTDLQLIGNLFLIAIPATFLIGFKRSPLFILPIAILILNERFFASSLWTMASLSNFPVLFFASFTAHLVTRNSARHWVVAAALIPCLTLSQGNGLIMSILLTCFVILKRPPAIKLLFSASLLLSISLYNYNRVSINLPETLTLSLSHPLQAIEYFLAFLGSATSNYRFAFILALIVLASWGALLYKKPQIETTDILITFILFSAAAAAVNRSFFGVTQALDSRYAINSALLISALYIKALNQFSNSKAMLKIGITAAVLSLAYMNYAENTFKKYIEAHALISQRLRIESSGEVKGVYAPFYIEQSKEILTQSINLGIYLPRKSPN